MIWARSPFAPDGASVALVAQNRVLRMNVDSPDVMVSVTAPFPRSIASPRVRDACPAGRSRTAHAHQQVNVC